MGLAFVTE
jgi:hypothetical protein